MDTFSYLINHKKNMKITKYCYHIDMILISLSTTFLLGTKKIELKNHLHFR